MIKLYYSGVAIDMIIIDTKNSRSYGSFVVNVLRLYQECWKEVKL